MPYKKLCCGICFENNCQLFSFDITKNKNTIGQIYSCEKCKNLLASKKITIELKDYPLEEEKK